MDEKRINAALRILRELDGFEALKDTRAAEILEQQESELENTEQLDFSKSLSPKGPLVYPTILGTLNPFYVATQSKPF